MVSNHQWLLSNSNLEQQRANKCFNWYKQDTRPEIHNFWSKGKITLPYHSGNSPCNQIITLVIKHFLPIIQDNLLLNKNSLSNLKLDLFQHSITISMIKSHQQGWQVVRQTINYRLREIKKIWCTYISSVKSWSFQDYRQQTKSVSFPIHIDHLPCYNWVL